MQYQKPNALLFLTLAGFVATVTGQARADSTAETTGYYFKGPASTCLSHSTLVYSCVSMSPPAYKANSGVGIVSPAVITPDLPLDSSEHDSNWLTKLKNAQFWNSEWHLSHQLENMNVGFTLDQSEAGMSMDLGPMKLNVFANEGNISESGFFLGIHKSW